MHSITPGMDSSEPMSTAPLLPVMHTAVRPAPGTGSALYPSDSMRSHTARTCASVACDCMTTSMIAPGPIRAHESTASVILPANQERNESPELAGWDHG